MGEDKSESSLSSIILSDQEISHTKEIAEAMTIHFTEVREKL